MTEAAEPRLRLVGISLDCADPDELAAFYRDLLGGEIFWRSADSVGVRVPGAFLIPQLVPDYRPPTWPGASIVHLDLSAGADVDGPTARALALGARWAEPQPDERWHVLLDPAGHPFCITPFVPERQATAAPPRS
jgi:catechol 2,3-dioxygenase-like lactoylglutathione lyase family enzyme